MAKRFIDTDLFRKPFMRSLEAPYKALWIYLLCECDHAGVWVVELDVAQIRMGLKLDPEKVLDKMGGSVVAIDGGSKWYLPDFVAFQYGTLNPANKVHGSVIERLSRYGIDPNDTSQNKPLASPFQGAKDKDKDKDISQEGKERAHEAEIEPTFKQWFDLYAKSRDKEACRAKWTALGQDIHEAIMDHTRRYVVAQPDKLYRKDPIRYLTKRGWEDEIVESKTNGTRTNTNDPDERRRLVIEANAEHFRQQREFEARHQPGGIPDPAHG
jgi:hypothetical protein